VNDIRRNTLAWMALALSASLGLAISIIAAFGINPGLSIALRATAGLAFLIFLPAYVGGPLTSLFGNAFLPVRRHARDFGLAFASAMVVHLGLVIWLCAIGKAPPVKTFVVFGLAAVSIYLLALLSVRRVRELLPQKFWPPLRVVTTNYIALAFIDDFKNFPVNDFYGDIAYLPFAALAIGGVILTLVAWAQNLGYISGKRASAAKLCELRLVLYIEICPRSDLARAGLMATRLNRVSAAETPFGPQRLLQL
jgi:hypothetical protein